MMTWVSNLDLYIVFTGGGEVVRYSLPPPQKQEPRRGQVPPGSLTGGLHVLARSRSFGHRPSLCEKAKENMKTYVNVSLKKLLLQRLEQGS